MSDFTKQSTERLNYTVDWAAETTDQSDTISSSVWSVPSGLTVYSDSNTTTSATAYIEGGVHGVEYKCVNTITTAAALIIEQSFSLLIDDNAEFVEGMPVFVDSSQEIKGPSPAVHTFRQDWSDHLASGDSVSTSSWTVESGVTVDSDSLSSNVAIATISGGTLGKTYRIDNNVTTADGEDKTRAWFLKIQNSLN